MPISDPGISSGRGFTLIEVLVVLLIMGLLAGLVSSLVRPDDRGLLRLEAERLAQLLDLAAAESRLTGNATAWTADGPGYRFWRMTEDAERSAQWSEILDSDLLRARTLPQGMLVAGLQIANDPTRGAMRLAFTPHGPALPFSIAMSLGTARYAVAASPIGEISVSPGQGDSSDGPAPR
jgi:general secretion pathway protein H